MVVVEGRVAVIHLMAPLFVREWLSLPVGLPRPRDIGPHRARY